MEMVGSAVLFFSFGLVLAIVIVAIRFVYKFWWRPKCMERVLREKGLKGNPHRFPLGDAARFMQLQKEAKLKPLPLSHDIAARVLPYAHEVLKQHGKTCFVFVFGPSPIVATIDPEMVKEVIANKFGHFLKPRQSKLSKLIETGLLVHEGEKWVKHRRIINPAFHMEKLKLMLAAFSTCCDELINKWNAHIGSKESAELDVWPEFQHFTGDIISRTAFGSSYEEGQHIFHLQCELGKLVQQMFPYSFIPGYLCLPSKENIRTKQITKEVNAIITNMIEQREQAMRRGEANTTTDLLGLMLESNRKDSELEGLKNMMTIEDIIDECKIFYLAGHETTAVLLTFTMVALSMHSEWQERAREEVLQVFGNAKPDYDGMNRLKTVTNILYEVLRLYPPAIGVGREISAEVTLGGITFPKGLFVEVPILFMHHNQDFWGSDVHEFKPERFAEGISKASKVPGVFLPFGGGPRICIGQNFALLEAKMALARILQCFSFALSPSYIHAPTKVLLLNPQHGAQIILQRI